MTVDVNAFRDNLREAIAHAWRCARYQGNPDVAAVLDALREHLEAGTVGELAMLIERGREPLVWSDGHIVTCDRCGAAMTSCGEWYRCLKCGNAERTRDVTCGPLFL